MVKYIITIILCVSLSACNLNKSKEPEIVYKEVKVPTYIFPKIEPPIRPELEINNLSEEQKNDLGILAKTYVITINQLENYGRLWEELINNYNKKASNP